MNVRRNSFYWSPVTVFALAVVCAQGFAPQVAFAQDDENAADTAAARTLAIDGVKLAQSGRCAEAVDKLERAEALHHSTIVLGRLGECKLEIGKLVEGTELLRKMLREPLPSNPNPALQQAYQRAQNALAAAKPRIGSLTLVLNIPKETDVTLLVDGNRVPPAAFGAEIPTDPGEHAIEVSAPGFLKNSVSVTLGAGARRTITLKLERDPNAPAATEETSEPELKGNELGPRRAEPARSRPAANPVSPGQEQPLDTTVHRAPAYLTWTAAALGLGVGVGFGVAALSDGKTLNKSCVNNLCPREDEDALKSAKLKGNISTLGFGIGAAGAVLGTILYFTVGKSSHRAGAESAAWNPHRGPLFHQPRAAVGLNGVRFIADF